MAKDIKVKTRYVTKDIKTINRAKLLFGKLRIADAKIRTLRSKSEDERDSLTPESYGANKAEEVGKLGIDTALASVKMRGLRSRNMNAAADKISSNKAAINEAARRADTHPVNNTAQLKTQKTFIGRGSLHGLSPTAKSGGVHEKSARSFAGSRNTYGEKSIRKAGVYDQSRLSGASILKSRHINAQAKSLAMRNAKKKNAGATAKVSASAFSRTVKSILAAVKSLWVLLSAGGFAAVLAVIIITIVSIVAGSAFGIFFTGESSAGGWLPLKAAVSELTNEFAAEIESIKINNPHDELKMEIPGSNPSIDWKQVLAVFAVASAEDAVNPMPVSSFDEHNLNRLRAVMFDMNNVHSSVHTEFYTRTMPVIDGEPDTSEIVTVTILTISITKKNTDEMVLQYAFTKSQKESLAELLAKENDALWAELLGSIAPGGRGIPAEGRISG
jgi:hypothetical protein